MSEVTDSVLQSVIDIIQDLAKTQEAHFCFRAFRETLLTGLIQQALL